MRRQLAGYSAVVAVEHPAERGGNAAGPFDRVAESGSNVVLSTHGRTGG